jgi:hypothetical protein
MLGDIALMAVTPVNITDDLERIEFADALIVQKHQTTVIELPIVDSPLVGTDQQRAVLARFKAWKRNGLTWEDQSACVKDEAA